MSSQVDVVVAAAEIPDDLISVPTAAKLLAVHVSTIYLTIRKRELRAWRRSVGGHARVSKAEVLALLVPVELYPAAEVPRADAQAEADSAAAVERLRRKGYKAGAK